MSKQILTYRSLSDVLGPKCLWKGFPISGGLQGKEWDRVTK